MRLPKLPVRRTDADFDPEEAYGPDSTDIPAQPDGYGDLPLPALPPPPLTSELTKSIRFTISEPQGYFFDQVENFVAQVIDALAYYEQAEFQYKQVIYDMQVEADQQSYDVQRLRSEIELFKVQGSPMVNADGSYVTESQQEQVDTLVGQLAEAQALVERLQADAQADQIEIARLRDEASAKDAEIVSLRQMGDQLTHDMQMLRTELDAAQAGMVPVAESLTGDVQAEEDQPQPPTVGVEEAEGTEPAPVEDLTPEPADPEPADTNPAPVHDDVPVIDLTVTDLSPEDTDDVYEDDDIDLETDTDGLHSPAREPEQVEPVTDSESTVEAVGDTAATHGDFDETEDALPNEPEQSAPVETATPTVEDEDEDVTVTEDPADLTDEQATDIGQGAGDDTEDVEGDGPGSPEGSEDDEEWEGDAKTVPVVPVESELPEGTELPGTGEAAVTYPPAAPGVPLDTRGVPVEVWAPELDPRIQAAIAEQAKPPTKSPEPEPEAEGTGDAEGDSTPEGDA